MIAVGRTARISFPSAIAGRQAMVAPTIGRADFVDKVQMFGTLRGRLGVVVDHWLTYTTAGLAWTYDALARADSRNTAGTRGWRFALAEPPSPTTLLSAPVHGGGLQHLDEGGRFSLASIVAGTAGRWLNQRPGSTAPTR